MRYRRRTPSTQQPSIRRYRIRPPEVWREVRLGWARGESGPSLAGRLDIPTATIYQRRDREKWTRDADVQASLPEVRRTEVVIPAPTDALEIAQTALARATEARCRSGGRLTPWR